MIHVGCDKAAAWNMAPALDDQIVAGNLDLDAIDAQHIGGRRQAVGFLDTQFLQPPHDGSTFRKGSSHRQYQISVDHRRRTRRRHLDAPEFQAAHGQFPHRLPGFAAPLARRAPCPLSPTFAPISSSASRTRRIGRERNEASPSKTAEIGQPATAPITSRQPVPELPKSSGPGGCAKPATPTPSTAQAKSPVRSTLAPSERMALAVLSTSSPSSRPEIRVRPTASAPKIRARCEIDLSQGK